MGKKLVQINTVCNASTGRIMHDIQRAAEAAGYDTISFVGRRKPYTDVKCEKFGNGLSFWVHVILNTLFDCQGYGSYVTTKKLLRRLREEQPDIIHLHNLHGYYVNLPLLMGYLRKEFRGKLFWTFHDCWPFTGHCPHFVAAGCYRWRDGCHHCPSKREYPVSLFLDASRRNYANKKKLFGSLKNLTVITPSAWMAGWAADSFFRQCPIKVVPNGIDLDTFFHRPDERALQRHHIPRDKKILLGVAAIWDRRKGLQDFLSLSEELSEEYQIVLVGLSKRQIRRLPKKVIGIERTEDRRELAALYSAAHIFINPSREESFSLVTAEAIACGTPVIVLDGSAVQELVCPDNGIVLKKHGTADYLEAIARLEQKGLGREQISRTAQKYDVRKVTSEMIGLYEGEHCLWKGSD